MQLTTFKKEPLTSNCWVIIEEGEAVQEIIIRYKMACIPRESAPH